MQDLLVRSEGGEVALLETLYQAPFETPRWRDFLAQLVDATGSRSARMLIMDRVAQSVHSSLKHNIDDSAHRDYVEHFVNACPWRPELRFKAPGRLYSTYHDFSCRQPAFYRTEFFNDWARQQDIHHGVCGTVWQDQDSTVQLLIQRTGGQGPYTAEDSRRINQLVPHIRQSMRLARQVEALRAQQSLVALSQQRYGVPFAITDQRGNIHYLCDNARQLIDRTAGLEVRAGRLVSNCSRSSGRLRQLLQACGQRPGQAGFGPGGLVPIDRPAAPPLYCLVCPVPEHPVADMLWPATGRPTALIYFQDPCGKRLVDETLLIDLFDFSPAESAIAAGIASGAGLEDIAEARGCSIHTVRSQLKQVLRKTGCHRQSELAHVITSSLACLSSQAPLISLENGVVATAPRRPASKNVA